MAKKSKAKKAVKKAAVKKSTVKKKTEVQPVAGIPVLTIKDATEEEFENALDNGELLEHFMKSHDVMELIKSQFGYSGYSNPNYIGLDKQIQENKKLIEKLKLK